MSDRTAWIYNLWGWLLFIASAIFFIIASVMAGDLITTIASLLFLLACLIFLVPLWAKRPPRN